MKHNYLFKSKLLEYAVELEVFDLLSNSRVKKFDVIEAISSEDAKKKAIWKHGTYTEVESVYLF